MITTKVFGGFGELYMSWDKDIILQFGESSKDLILGDLL